MIGTVVDQELTIGEAFEMLSRELRVKIRDDERMLNGRIFTPNGWTISVGFGSYHYCSNRQMSPFMSPMPFKEAIKGDDCEIAIFDPNDDWFVPHGGDQVWGYVSTQTLLKVVDAVALYREGGPCPCPDCVGER